MRSFHAFLAYSLILYPLKTPENGLKAVDYIHVHLISQGSNTLESIFILVSQLIQH